MELQTAITIALAIAALVVSTLAIVLSILFYRFQTQQGNRIARDNTDFATAMHGLLGEIRGVTTSTLGQVQEQFSKMLDAMLHIETTDIRAAVGSATDEMVRNLHPRVEALEQALKMGQVDTTEARRELDAIAQTIHSLTSTMDEALEKAADAIRREREPSVRLDTFPVQTSESIIIGRPVGSFAPSGRTSRFEKLTERARKVLTMSEEEARDHGHNYLGTEHMLLGLVREGEGVGAKVLISLGVELDKVRSAVEYIIGRGERSISGEIGLTPRAKHVIELAVDEARRLNHNYIGTQHLLLGLLREEEGVAAGVLEVLGVSLENARAETVKLTGGLESD